MTYTTIIPTKQTAGDRVYDTGDGYVELRETRAETPPSAPAYEVVEGSAADVANTRGWEKV